MAKTKKDISKFQEALSSNTEFLNEDSLEDEVLFGDEIKGNQVVSIDGLIFKKFKILSMYHKREMHDVLHEALNHYLRLKKIDLEAAMFELTKEK